MKIIPEIINAFVLLIWTAFFLALFYFEIKHILTKIKH